MKDAKKLAKLLSDNIMIFHDNADYSGLESNSVKIVLEMGYPKEKSRKTGKHIRKIYESYDVAQTEYEKGNTEKEKEHYKKAKELARKINKTLDDSNDSQVLVDIVIQWRHRNKLGSLFQIFRYWKNNLPLIPALKCTVLQIKAGLCHDKRDSGCFERNFLGIYRILLSHNKIPILF